MNNNNNTELYQLYDNMQYYRPQDSDIINILDTTVSVRASCMVAVVEMCSCLSVILYMDNIEATSLKVLMILCYCREHCITSNE